MYIIENSSSIITYKNIFDTLRSSFNTSKTFFAFYFHFNNFYKDLDTVVDKIAEVLA